MVKKKKKKNQKSNCKYYLQDLEKQRKISLFFCVSKKNCRIHSDLKKFSILNMAKLKNPQKIIALKKSKP